MPGGYTQPVLIVRPKDPCDDRDGLCRFPPANLPIRVTKSGTIVR